MSFTVFVFMLKLLRKLLRKENLNYFVKFSFETLCAKFLWWKKIKIFLIVIQLTTILVCLVETFSVWKNNVYFTCFSMSFLNNLSIFQRSTIVSKNFRFHFRFIIFRHYNTHVGLKYQLIGRHIYQKNETFILSTRLTFRFSEGSRNNIIFCRTYLLVIA